MPVKQQYFAALAIIGLIVVLVLFAMFDYFSDRSRFAEQMAVTPQGAASFAGAMPYAAEVNPLGYSTSSCPWCGWAVAGADNSQCRNCGAFLGNSGVGTRAGNAQNAGFMWFRQEPREPSQPRGVLYCSACDFAMSCKYETVPNSIQCPRCASFLVLSKPSGAAAPGRGGSGRGGSSHPAGFSPGQVMGPFVNAW